MPTSVVNISRAGYNLYIGRKQKPLHWGNPFRVSYNCNRLRAVLMFYDWLTGADHQEVEPERRKWILERIEDLRGSRLGCYCAPKLCHGHVYMVLLGELEVEDLHRIYREYGE